MQRIKFGLIASALVMLVAGVVSVSITAGLRATAAKDVEDKLTRAQQLHHQIARLDGSDFAGLAAELARRPGVASVFDKAGTEKQQVAFEECEAINVYLAKNARKADILAILDASGKVIARDLNPKAMVGEDLKSKYPTVGIALSGVPTKDIWNFSNRMTRAAVAPVLNREGRTQGALLIGYVVAAQDAQSKRDALGVDVVFFHAGKVHTTSFGGKDEAQDGGRSEAINKALFENGDRPGAAALAKGDASGVFRLTLDGVEYAAIAAPLPGNATDKASGVCLLGSIGDAAAGVGAVGRKVLIVGVLAALLALAASFLTAMSFAKPLDEIELGVGEIINGNIDYEFRPVGREFEGLSNGLNVMLARLLGREERDENAVEEEDEAAPRWRSDLLVVDEAAGAAALASGSQDAALVALGEENESNHYARLYNEYLAAMKARGGVLDGITPQAFTAKLRLIEGGLRQKWKCRAVRFRLDGGGGGDIVLSALPIA